MDSPLWRSGHRDVTSHSNPGTARLEKFIHDHATIHRQPGPPLGEHNARADSDTDDDELRRNAFPVFEDDRVGRDLARRFPR